MFGPRFVDPPPHPDCVLCKCCVLVADGPVGLVQVRQAFWVFLAPARSCFASLMVFSRAGACMLTGCMATEHH